MRKSRNAAADASLSRVSDPNVVDRVLGPSECVYELGGGKVPVTEMTEADIDRFVEHYKQGAINAIKAGFDGVEIHGANGYVS